MHLNFFPNAVDIQSLIAKRLKAPKLCVNIMEKIYHLLSLIRIYIDRVPALKFVTPKVIFYNQKCHECSVVI